MLQNIGHLVSPLTLLALMAGCLVAGIARSGVRASLDAARSLRVLRTADPDRDMLLARMAMSKVDQLASLKGLPAADRVRTANPFLAQAIRKLAETTDVDQFEIWADQQLADRAARHENVQKFWTSVASTAPTMGLTGTIIGLVGVFAAMEDAARVGTPVAMTLLASLYGLVIANFIAAPITARLRDLSERELAWQRELCRRMLAVARREIAPMRRARIRRVA